MDKNLKLLITAIFIFFILFFIPFWVAISLSTIFSFLLFPLLCRIDKHHRVKGKRAVAALIIIITTLILLVPFALGFYSATSRVMVLAKEAKGRETIDVLEAEGFKKGLIQRVKEISKSNNVSISRETIEGINKVSDSVEQKILETSKQIIISLPEFAVHLLIFTLGFYIFLYYGHRIKLLLLKYKILTEKDLAEFIEVAQEASYQTVISLIIVGTVQSVVVLAGAWISGFEELLLIFSLTFILSFIPVIGAAPVALVLAVVKFIQEDWKIGVFLLFISLVAGTIDNVLKPMLLKRKSHMDEAISLITIIGAIVLLGLPGLFIGPVIGFITAHYFEKVDNKVE